MIYDCFTFYNEFDILELRLRTLGDTVDHFVICEAPFTFRGDPKPLFFAEHAARFAPWMDRIRIVTYPGPPDANAWKNEWGQRDFLATALAACAPDDLILIGDVDEIPDPAFATRRPAANGVLVHDMILMRGFANRADAGGTFSWPGTRALAYADLAAYTTLSNVRQQPAAAFERVASGWHFSSLGGGAVMEAKMRAYSHAEYDIPYYRDRRRLDIHYRSEGGDDAAVEVPLERLPAPLRDDARWHAFLWKQLDALDGPRATRLEHAHGLLAYVPEDARRVAVLSADRLAFNDAGATRFTQAFAGVFAAAPDLLAAAAPDYIVIDGIECFATELLEQLRGIDAPIVLFAANARSQRTLAAALNGRPLPAGRAAGRAEAEAAALAAGRRIAHVDRVANRTVPWVTLPPETPVLYNLTIPGFHFAELGADALHDFQSDAFILSLTPPADTVEA